MTEQRIAELEAMSERGTIRRGHVEEMLKELRRLHEVNQKLLDVLQSFDGSYRIDQFDTNTMPSRAWNDTRLARLAAITIAKAGETK